MSDAPSDPRAAAAEPDRWAPRGSAREVWAPRGSAREVESGDVFQPLFDEAGLIPAICSDAATGEVVMFAWMSRDAVAATVETGVAHFWSRSRAKIWRKGEESGNELQVVELRTDCDQDVLWLKVRVAGRGVACHTGARSCFYRRVELGDGAQRPLKLSLEQA